MHCIHIGKMESNLHSSSTSVKSEPANEYRIRIRTDLLSGNSSERRPLYHRTGTDSEDVEEPIITPEIVQHHSNPNCPRRMSGNCTLQYRQKWNVVDRMRFPKLFAEQIAYPHLCFAVALFNTGSTFFNIPYIYRFNIIEKYCSVRMLLTELKLIYPKLMKLDIFPWLRCHNMSFESVRLFDYINYVQCNSKYGVRPFATSDIMISMNDTNQIVTFLNNCRRKFTAADPKLLGKFGFIKIYVGFVVPYVLRESDSKRMIPLYHFDGHTYNKCLLNGWDLSYIKLCSAIQGIDKSFYNKDFIEMVELNNVFSSSSFTDYWPCEALITDVLDRSCEHAVSLHTNAVSVKF